METTVGVVFLTYVVFVVRPLPRPRWRVGVGSAGVVVRVGEVGIVGVNVGNGVSVKSF